MKNNMSVTFKPVLVSAIFSMFCYPAYAASDFSFTGGVGLEAHDNPALSHTDEESDTKRLISADVGYKKDDGELTADIGYSAEYADYLHDVEGDETTINGRTALKWLIAPRQFDAFLYHQISQQLTDRRGLDVESNHEERSIVTAGFNGYLHLSAVDSLILSPSFTDVRYKESDNSDSTRASLAATLDHKISKVSSVALEATYADVKFDDDGENDYRSPGLMLSFNTTLARLNYQLGVGGSRIERDEGKDFSGSKIIAAINYKGDGQEWGASYLRELTDNSIGLSGAELQVTNFQSNDSNTQEVDIVLQDKFDAYWRNHINASNLLLLGIGYQKEDFKDTSQDQEIAYAQLGYQYTINTRWSAAFDAHFERTKFLDDPTEQYDTTRVYLSAIYRPTRPLEVRFSVGQDKRDADTEQLSYTDNVALVGLRYNFF